MLMEVISAITTALIPLVFLIIPGVFIVKLNVKDNYFIQISSVILWSLVVTILLSLLVTSLKLPVYTAGLAIIIFACLEIWHNKSIFSLSKLRHLLLPLTAFLLIYLAFSVPFLQFHSGLPTGDSQKAIFWAEHIIDNNRLPDYSLSKQLMNRDPVDFYTPGLHSYTALLMQLSPYPLTTVGFMAIALAIAAGFMGAGIAQVILPRYKLNVWLAFFTILFSLTHFRFLRYIREPGYHLQNIAGEVLLFGLLFLGLKLLQRLSWKDAVLFVLTAAALLFTHQLSTFLAAFIFIPLTIIWLWQNRLSFLTYIKEHKPVWISLIVFAITVLTLLINLDLHKKVNHIFTTNPHLLHLTLNITEHIPMLGPIWLLSSLFGLITLWVYLFRNRSLPLLAFLTATTLLFILSQGPRLGINIPPVRTLFYSILPLSIAASFFLTEILRAVNSRFSVKERFLGLTCLIIIIGISMASSLSQAYNLSHTIRTNATLTGGQLHLIDFLKQDDSDAAVLIDDYNRRSSSWLLLGGNAMYTRIGADIQRQMNEAHQTPTRYNLYLAQLDYEKIFAMGSFEAIIELMAKHNIRYVTGISRTSSSSFARNKALQGVAKADDITLYSIKTTSYSSPYPDNITSWLLRPTTLVNNIGDRQDTFAHLPASLRSSRLSEPEHDDEKTWRTTSAPYITLQFNVGSYTSVLYDQEKTGYADTSLELFVDFATNSPIEVITPSGKHLSITSKEPLKIKGTDLPWDDSGFINLVLHNPNQEDIQIYFIALGLARTP